MDSNIMNEQPIEQTITRLRQHLEHLAGTIGERHLGSEGEERAKEYIAEHFRGLGYTTVLEPFAVPGWRYGNFGLTVNGESLPSFPCYFSPGGAATAPLQEINPQAPGFQMPDLSGRIAFVGNYQFGNVHETNALALWVEEAGAAALIINSPYNDTFSTKIIRNPKVQAMPVFTVSLRTALTLAAAAAENATADIFLEAERFEHTSHNVVARYVPPGSAAGKIVIGGHFDTAPGIAGAADNGTGTVLTLHLAERLKDSLGALAVDFVAFGGEEYVDDATVDPGVPGYGTGGFAYAQIHAGEMQDIQAMLNLDDIGTYLGEPVAHVGRSARLRQIIRDESTEANIPPVPYTGGGDNGIFNKHGIPTVWFFDTGPTSGVRHFPLHSPQDDLHLIDWRRFARIARDVERIALRVVTEGVGDAPDQAAISRLKETDKSEVVALVRSVWSMGIAATRERLYGRTIGSPWRDQIEKAVLDYLAEPGVEALCVRWDGRFAGFIGFRADPQTQIGEIGYNAVAPEFSGRGLGSRLLDAALAGLKLKGMERAEVVTGLDPGHAPARKMYEAAGFRPLQSLTRYTTPLS